MTKILDKKTSLLTRPPNFRKVNPRATVRHGPMRMLAHAPNTTSNEEAIRHQEPIKISAVTKISATTRVIAKASLVWLPPTFLPIRTL